MTPPLRRQDDERCDRQVRTRGGAVPDRPDFPVVGIRQDRRLRPDRRVYGGQGAADGRGAAGSQHHHRDRRGADADRRLAGAARGRGAFPVDDPGDSCLSQLLGRRGGPAADRVGDVHEEHRHDGRAALYHGLRVGAVQRKGLTGLRLPWAERDRGHTMPLPIQFQWNTPPSTIDAAAARTNRMIIAGMPAIAHLTSRITMDTNGILTSTTTTSFLSLLIGSLVHVNWKGTPV